MSERSGYSALQMTFVKWTSIDSTEWLKNISKHNKNYNHTLDFYAILRRCYLKVLLWKAKAAFLIKWPSDQYTSTCTPAPYCLKDFLNLPDEFWPILFDFATVFNGDSGQSDLTLQLFPMEIIVTSNLIGQNNPINQRKCFIQLGDDYLCHTWAAFRKTLSGIWRIPKAITPSATPGKM